MRCERCGYDLSATPFLPGHEATRTCPECGSVQTPRVVGLSATGKHRWVRWLVLYGAIGGTNIAFVFAIALWNPSAALIALPVLWAGEAAWLSRGQLQMFGAVRAAPAIGLWMVFLAAATILAGAAIGFLAAALRLA